MFEILAKQIGKLIVDELRRQYRIQGHNLTGKLIASIEDKVTLTVTGAKVQVLIVDYGVIVNNGTPASRIPYTPGRGRGGTSKYIQGLQNFARLRMGLSAREALSVAFAIARKQSREGMPTRGSFKFSKNGKRTGAIEDTLKIIDNKIVQLTTDFVEEIITMNLAV
jgi:hypothetical protein